MITKRKAMNKMENGVKFVSCNGKIIIIPQMIDFCLQERSSEFHTKGLGLAEVHCLLSVIFLSNLVAQSIIAA